MTFTDQKPWTITDEDLRANGGGRGLVDLSCGLCSHVPVVGETWRWVLMRRTLNTFVCEACDGPDVKDRFLLRQEQATDEVKP